MFAYGATLILLVWLALPLVQWSALIAVSAATAASIALWERFDWQLGLAVRPRLAIAEFGRGLLWGFLLIVAGVLLIMACTTIRPRPGNGFPWLELVAVFIPAVLHEELLFRGYPYQKLRRWNPTFALWFFAFVFAAMHLTNDSLTVVGITNIFLGGIVLALAYERFQRLWFPIGFHLAWNLTTGPFFGDEVSGFDMRRSVLVETGGGPQYLTGGDFGVEGSVILTLVELAAIALLWRRISSARSAFRSGQHEGVTA